VLLVLSKPSDVTPEDIQLPSPDWCEACRAGKEDSQSDDSGGELEDQETSPPYLTELNESFLIFVICDGGNLLFVVRIDIFITSSFVCGRANVFVLVVTGSENHHLSSSLMNTKHQAPRVIFRRDNCTKKGSH